MVHKVNDIWLITLFDIEYKSTLFPRSKKITWWVKTGLAVRVSENTFGHKILVDHRLPWENHNFCNRFVYTWICNFVGLCSHLPSLHHENTVVKKLAFLDTCIWNFNTQWLTIPNTRALQLMTFSLFGLRIIDLLGVVRSIVHFAGWRSSVGGQNAWLSSNWYAIAHVGIAVYILFPLYVCVLLFSYLLINSVFRKINHKLRKVWPLNVLALTCTSSGWFFDL